MNYLLEIKAFFDLQEINRLSSGQIALWLALMHINNKVGWTQEFTVSNQTLQFKSGLTRDGVYKARNVLKQKGYISFKESGGGQASKYTMVSLSNNLQDSLQDDIRPGLQVSLQDGIHPNLQVGLPLNKQNKTKLNNNKKPSKKGPYEAYTENKALLEALKAFEDHRKQLRKPMTDHAKDLMLKDLDKLAAPFTDKDRYKIEAINEAISRGWLKLFPLKEFRDGLSAQADFVHDPEDHPTLLKPGMRVEDLI